MTSRRLIRIVGALWLTAAGLKVGAFWDLYQPAHRYPVLSHPFFPSALLSTFGTAVAWALPFFAYAGFFVRARSVVVATAVVFGLCALYLSWNINSFNDATWVVLSWVSLWLAFASGQCDREDAGARRQVDFLARAIVAMVFLGGFVGKLTPGYLDGTILLELYVQKRAVFPWTWVREFPVETQRAIAQSLSAFTLVAEGAMVLVVFSRHRWSRLAALGFMAGMVALSHWMLLSVVGGLMAMLWAAGRWPGAVPARKPAS
jgi:hypothetical protein